MAVTCYTYAGWDVSLDTIDALQTALENHFSGDVNFSVNCIDKDFGYSYNNVDCNDKELTISNFESYLANRGDLEDNVHYQLIVSCNFGGRAKYAIGKDMT